MAQVGLRLMTIPRCNDFKGSKFARFAKEVWKIKEENEKSAAEKGINALADFIKEIGLPTTLREMGITNKSCFESVAKSCNITAGCCKKLSSKEILQILEECFDNLAAA